MLALRPMSKLHDALHAAREQIRQIDLDGIVFEDNVNRAQHGIANYRELALRSRTPGGLARLPRRRAQGP